MRKNFFYTAALLLAGAVMAACSGSDDITSDVTPEPQPSAEVGTVELSGTLGSKGSTTRAVDADGNGTWEVGDKFAVYYQTANDHASAEATVNRVNNDGSADFTATLESPKIGNNTVKLVYPYSAHDGQGGFKTDALLEQRGTLDYINENGLDIETAAATMNVEGTTASLTSNVQMLPEVCLYTMKLKSSIYNYNSLPATKLEIFDGTHDYTIILNSSGTSELTVALLPVSNASFSFLCRTTWDGVVITKQKGVTLQNCTAANVGHVIDKKGIVYAISNGPGACYYGEFSDKSLVAGNFYSGSLDLLPVDVNFHPVAMIAYVGEPGTADTSTGSENYHGLAIAMNDMPETDLASPYSNDVYKSKYWWGGHNSETACTFRSTSFTAHWNYETGTFGDLKGIGNTERLATGACGHNDHNAAIAAVMYGDLIDFDPSHFGGSNWFLPSSGQWMLVFGACGATLDGWTTWGWASNVNSYRNPVKDFLNKNWVFTVGTRIWSSSEYNKENAVSVGIGSMNNTDSKAEGNTSGYGCRVHPFFAF